MKFWTFGQFFIIWTSFVSYDRGRNGLVMVGGCIFQSMRSVLIRIKPVEGGWMQTIEIVLFKVYCLKICKCRYYFMGVSIGVIIVRVIRKSTSALLEMQLKLIFKEVSILYYFIYLFIYFNAENKKLPWENIE